jgi:restriction endonuclease S subunit
VDKETLDKEIQRAFQHYQKERLKLDDLCALTAISKGTLKHNIFKYYDSWAEACETNGGKCGPTGAENLKPTLVRLERN